MNTDYKYQYELTKSIIADKIERYVRMVGELKYKIVDHAVSYDTNSMNIIELKDVVNKLKNNNIVALVLGEDTVKIEDKKSKQNCDIHALKYHIDQRRLCHKHTIWVKVNDKDFSNTISFHDYFNNYIIKYCIVHGYKIPSVHFRMVYNDVHVLNALNAIFTPAEDNFIKQELSNYNTKAIYENRQLWS